MQITLGGFIQIRFARCLSDRSLSCWLMDDFSQWCGKQTSSNFDVVCYTAVFRVVTQCSSPLWGGEERCVMTLKTAVYQGAATSNKSNWGGRFRTLTAVWFDNIHNNGMSRILIQKELRYFFFPLESCEPTRKLGFWKIFSRTWNKKCSTSYTIWLHPN